MEEPLFAEVEEKPTVVKIEEPSDYEEKPVVDTEDFIDSTELPTNERPRATVSPSNAPNLHKNQEISSFQGFLRPRCAICLKEFPNWIDLANHDALFKGRPHVFCSPCDLAVRTADHKKHLKSNHAAVTTQTTGFAQNQVSLKPHLPFIHQESQNSAEVQVQKPIGVARRGRPPKEQPNYVIHPWEKAAGAQKAEDILLGIEPEEAPLNQPKVKMGGMKRRYQDVASPRLFYEEKDAVPIGPKQRFPCPVRKCGHGFLVFDLLAEHMSQEHPGMKSLWCDLCPASFDATTKFWHHMERHHGVSKPLQDPDGYSCEDCGKHFALETPYYNHRMKWLGRPHSFCCNVEIKAEDLEKHKNSQTHTQVKDPDPVPCDECGKKFTSLFVCRNHTSAFGGTPHRHCEPCNMTIREGEWEKHLESKEHMVNTLHVTADEPKACEECGVVFRSTVTYVNHWERFGGRPHFHCRPCKKVFGGTEEEHLGSKEHRRSSGETDQSARWKCFVAGCGAAFPAEKFLIDHLHGHPGELPFACSRCPQAFLFKTNLKHHMGQAHHSSL